MRRFITAVAAATAAALISTIVPVANSLETGPGAPGPVDGVDLTDVGLEGEALPPSRDVAASKRQLESKSSTLELSEPVTGFRTTGFTLRDVPAALLPYANSKLVPRDDAGVHDATGVRMFLVDGKLYNHPVGQAQWGLANLESYRLSGDDFFLDRAVLQAQRLVDTRVESRDAWWYPYDFDFAVHGDTKYLLTAPWYSDMAQGQALSLFVRLHEATGDPAWRQAADATFRSLSLGPAPDVPWGTWVDDQQNLWLEEYPRNPAANSERVLNGHMFAAFGLFDYHRLTGDPRAAELYDGAVTTVLNTVESDFRSPQWASVYSLFHRRPHVNYHQVHIGQLLALDRQTGHLKLAWLADLLRADYPAPVVSRTTRISAGEHHFYKFDANGKITSSKVVSFSRATAAPGDRRQRIKDRGIYLRVSAGPYTGWWLAESRPAQFLSGPTVTHSYIPSRWLTVLAGTHSAYRYDANGKVIGTKTATFTRSSGAPFTATAIVDGRLAVYVPAGAFKGYWLPVTSKVQLDTGPRF